MCGVALFSYHTLRLRFGFTVKKLAEESGFLLEVGEGGLFHQSSLVCLSNLDVQLFCKEGCFAGCAVLPAGPRGIVRWCEGIEEGKTRAANSGSELRGEGFRQLIESGGEQSRLSPDLLFPEIAHREVCRRQRLRTSLSISPKLSYDEVITRSPGASPSSTSNICGFCRPSLIARFTAKSPEASRT